MLNQQMPAQARSFRQLLFLHTVTAIPVPLLSLAVAGFSHPSVWVFVHPGAHQSFGSGVFPSIRSSSPSRTSFIVRHYCLWLLALSSESIWVCVFTLSLSSLSLCLLLLSRSILLHSSSISGHGGRPWSCCSRHLSIWTQRRKLVFVVLWL